MTGRTDMLHGCVPSWRPDAQADRNYVPETALKQHLEGRHIPYGRLGEDGDALTIDDSTLGAARACRVARAAGHEVTLFVNPAQIARGRPYWFSVLDVLMDQRRARTAVFEGQVFELEPGRRLRAFRLAVKARLMLLAEADTDRVLGELAARLDSGAVRLAEHARTMALDDLRELADQGVRIESHGWDHRDPAAMTEAEAAGDLRRARQWFHDNLGFHPRHYAVPYGLTPLTGPAAHDVPGRILLADARLGPGALGAGHWNRRDITTEVRERCA